MISWAAHRPAVVLALAAGVVVSGTVAFSKLPLATKGTVELPRLQVTAGWSTASPELVETYLTSPIERAVQGVRGVRKTSSSSRQGLCVVNIDLDPKADVTMTRLAIVERIEALRPEFPASARAPSVSNYVPEELTAQQLLEINVVGPYTPGALSKIVQDDLVPRLSSVPGVSSVRANGGATNGVTIAYDPAVLHQLDVDPADLVAALGSARQVQPLGQVRRGGFELSVSVNDQPHAVADLAHLPVVASAGRVFELGQLATVHPEEDAGGSFYRINGQTAVSLSLFREAAADAIKTAALGRAAVRELQARMPPGVRLDVTSDESEDLAKELRDLLTRGLIAFAAVFVVLVVTLQSLSGGVLVLASAGIAIAGAALTLYLLHIPANLLTLAGLGMGIGILVQNGLVVVERLRAAKNTPASRAEAGRRIAPAVLGSTLTTTVVLLPFLYLQGNARAMFAPFAGAFTIALFWSVATALMFVPAAGRGYDGQVRGWPRLARAYERMVRATLRWRYATFAFYLLAIAVLAWGFIKKVPRVDWGRGFGQPHETIAASVSFPRGSDPASLERMVTELEGDVVGQPGVAVVRTTGSENSGNVVVEFTAEGSQSDAPWVLSDKLIERAVLVGGTDQISVTKPQGAQGFYNSSGGGGSYSHRIRVLGYSYDGVLQLAQDLKQGLERFPRVRDVNINAGSYGYRDRSVSVALVPDRSALARVGANASDYAASVREQIFSAAATTTLEIGNDQLPIMLRAAGARDRDTAQLAEGMVSNPLHAPVRIRDVSTVREVEGLAEIRRENQQYIREVTYDFRGPQKLADRTHKSFMESLTTPPGYTVTDERDFGYNDNSAKGLDIVIVVGLVLVLLAVALVFDSVWAAWMVLLALPMALGGVVAAFWITKTAFTREAYVGGILVVGLAVNHSILLIDAALAARRRGGNRITAAEALHAATDRVTMIVLVTLTALASLVPMAVGKKPDSLFGAIALATAGGTIAGTLGVMFLLPAMLLGLRKDNIAKVGTE